MTQRTGNVGVRGGEPRQVTLYASHHGPIVAWKDDKAYAHRMAYHECVNGLEAWYRFNFAEDYRDVLRGLEGNEVFPQNVMVADAAGNIYYHRTGRVPRRPEGYDWSRPVPGHTSQVEWLGVHPQADLVHLLNPPAGYMQNCNIPPDAMLVDSPLQPDRYPTYIFGTTGGWTNERGARAVELLAAHDRVSAQQAIDFGLDVQPFGWQRWQEQLRLADAAQGQLAEGHAHYRAARDRLLAWDGQLEADSQGGLLYYYWRAELARDAQVGRGLPEVIDQHYRMVRSDQQFTPPELSPRQQQALVTAVTLAADKIVEHWGSLDARYGDKFRVGRDQQSWPLGGGGDFGTRTLRSISYGPEREDHTRWGGGGQTSTQIVVLSQPVRSWTQPPIGQSDRPDSPHYSDQAQRLLSPRKMKSSWWTPQELVEHVVSRQELPQAP